jgi:hypothetical protein
VKRDVPPAPNTMLNSQQQNYAYSGNILAEEFFFSVETSFGRNAILYYKTSGYESEARVHNSLREYENNNNVLISCTVVKEAGVAQSV